MRTMSNSSLVSYVKYSPNNYGLKTHSIDRITPHCVVGQCSVETLGDWFSKSSTKASCNYGIGKDGRVGLYVDENKGAWCSSNKANDQRSVTIECASDATHPYAFNDVVYNKLIDLCVDICKRNGKTKLIWISDKNTALNYSCKSNEMLLTVHRWFANKACPGDWLMGRMSDLASKVNSKLYTNSSNNKSKELYRVRKTWSDSATQLGAFYDKNAAIETAKKCSGYKVFDKDGKQVYPTSKTYSGGFPIIPPILSLKSKGLQVERLQKFLNWYGGYKLTVDGDFGNKTYSAVLDFQKKEKITIDGIFGTASLNKAKTIKK